MKTTDVPLTPCPTCGKILECASHTKREPRPGDLSVCIGCGELLAFDAHLVLHVADLRDLIGLDYRMFKRIGKLQALVRKKRIGKK